MSGVHWISACRSWTRAVSPRSGPGNAAVARPQSVHHSLQPPRDGVIVPRSGPAWDGRGTGRYREVGRMRSPRKVLVAVVATALAFSTIAIAGAAITSSTGAVIRLST